MEMHRTRESLENPYNTISSDTPSNASTYCSVRGVLNTGSVSSRDVNQSNEQDIYDNLDERLPQKKVRSDRAVTAILIVVLLVLLAALIATTLYYTVLREDNSKTDEQTGNTPVNGTWNDWQTWSDCYAFHGNCVMFRNRSCDNHPPSNGGNNCEGPDSENQSCKHTNCSVNGNWSVWLAWSSCSASCDNGTRTRNRTCDNPVPAFGDEDCDGIDTDSEVCMVINCPINVNWGVWLAWSSCSASCDNGTRTRNRTCDNPVPAFGGEKCDGINTDSEVCVIINCTINGNWSVWLAWSSCSVSCDNGTRTRNRTCNNPVPAFGGGECDGIDTDSEVCMILNCPINGNWSSWQPWSDCSTTCGGGIKNRRRNCDNPAPEHMGLDCDGHGFESSSCGEVTCSPAGVWGTWTEWTNCSIYCGEGVSSRTRICDNSAGFECIGNNSETKVCQNWKCYDSWGDWSACSFTCGSGIRTRNRTCDGKFTGEKCGWHPPTFREKKNCVNPESCQECKYN